MLQRYIPFVDGIISNSIKYEECLLVKCIILYALSSEIYIFLRNTNLSILATPRSFQPTHTKTKKKISYVHISKIFLLTFYLDQSKRKFQFYLLNSKDFSVSICVLWKHFIRYYIFIEFQDSIQTHKL